MSEVKKPKKMAIIVHSGSLDKLYPVFMLSSTGAAMDVETHLFFTFWGLNALKKGGLESAGLPGLMTIDTGMMKERIKNAKVPSLTELLKMCRQMGNVKIYACSTTMEMMGVKKEELIPEVDDIVGAASFLSIALDSDVQLFI
ncbi:MAG: DsrE/DsrF/DrsH-like family protein [Candidatus Bathyarchaeia archaeon]|jgi:peroxiredoxin family protein